MLGQQGVERIPRRHAAACPPSPAPPAPGVMTGHAFTATDRSVLNVHHERPVRRPDAEAGRMAQAESPAHDALKVAELPCLPKDGEVGREVRRSAKAVVDLGPADHDEQPSAG